MTCCTKWYIQIQQEEICTHDCTALCPDPGITCPIPFLISVPEQYILGISKSGIYQVWNLGNHISDGGGHDSPYDDIIPPYVCRKQDFEQKQRRGEEAAEDIPARADALIGRRLVWLSENGSRPLHCVRSKRIDFGLPYPVLPVRYSGVALDGLGFRCYPKSKVCFPLGGGLD